VWRFAKGSGHGEQNEVYLFFFMVATLQGDIVFFLDSAMATICPEQE
jgi:hypothetical protein